MSGNRLGAAAPKTTITTEREPGRRLAIRLVGSDYEQGVEQQVADADAVVVDAESMPNVGSSGWPMKSSTRTAVTLTTRVETTS